MKVIKAKEMGRIERLAYDRGASEEEFMNRAGEGVAELVRNFIARYHLKPIITLLCGKGNNAGDAYVAGRLLIEGGFLVNALAFSSFEEGSRLCQLQNKRFVEAGGRVEYIHKESHIHFSESELLVDGILGTGFRGEVEGLYRRAIESANASGLPILSIDIPSGIDGNTGAIGGVAIRAVETLFLGLPKSGSFIGEAWNWTGKIHVYDFGLDSAYIEKAEAEFHLIDDAMIKAYFPPIIRTRHKYQAGYVVGLGGSPGMPGAAIMASFAALRAGAGIVRLLHPAGMEAELAFSPHEVIRQGYPEGDLEAILKAFDRAVALFIGPGLGTSSSALDLLKGLLPKVEKPCVIDAGALTLIAHHDIPLPTQTIMTPHHGEMKRLLGIEEDLAFPKLLEESQAYVEAHRVTLVLKGAPTYILHPGEKPHLCARGDPGMATAGSGDILTGIVSACLAQVHDPLKAAILAVQIHALAGEYAAERFSSYSMTASDIAEALPMVFLDLVNAFFKM
ncbi:MAG: NAD(P)H-hydrate dehydratase [Chlamydiales bacterium]|nr:NAD(P)H-hydrate dehydratase [Chlamydiales bacterium]